MIAEKDSYIQSAYDQLQIISQDRQKRLEYEAREKAIRDHNQFLFEAEQRGMIYGVISMCKDLGLSEKETINKLREKFQLSETEAASYLQKPFSIK